MSSLRQPNDGHPRIQSGILFIPLFAENLAHSSVPLAFHAAVARSRGQGRPQAGARALPLTAPSTMASTRRLAAGGIFTERKRWTS
jgi:hypothetical protein